MPRPRFPLDPECPDVKKHNQFQQDPITIASGCGDEFYEDFARKHRKDCKRCMEYGAANLEIV